MKVYRSFFHVTASIYIVDKWVRVQNTCLTRIALFANCSCHDCINLWLDRRFEPLRLLIEKFRRFLSVRFARRVFLTTGTILRLHRRISPACRRFFAPRPDPI